MPNITKPTKPDESITVSARVDRSMNNRIEALAAEMTRRIQKDMPNASVTRAVILKGAIERDVPRLERKYGIKPPATPKPAGK